MQHAKKKSEHGKRKKPHIHTESKKPHQTIIYYDSNMKATI